MRALHLVALTAMSLLSLSSQCGKEEPTPAPPAQPQSPAPPVTPPPPPATPPVPACLRTIAFTQVPGLHLPGTFSKVGQTVSYVINSAAAYDALFTGTTLPQPAIDFTTHTLLIGKTRTGDCSYVLPQQVVQTCTGSYTYSVKLAPAACTANTDVDYHTLVDKLPANAQVDFDVQVLP